MRHKLLALLIVCALFAGCGSTETVPPEETETAENAEAEDTTETALEETEENFLEEEADTHILVAYFSATGNTAPLAEYAAEILAADLYEIEPLEIYTSDDLDYGNSSSRTSLEQNDADCRPELKESGLDLSVYDTIIIAHPIWWGKAPRLICTFLESYDFAGKTMVSFCTSASSGLGDSAEELRALLPESVNWLESRRFAIGTDKDEISAWLQEIGLQQ